MSTQNIAAAHSLLIAGEFLHCRFIEAAAAGAGDLLVMAERVVGAWLGRVVPVVQA
ncbi:hypothetical protein D3C81_1142650 [compost metagenome]